MMCCFLGEERHAKVKAIAGSYRIIFLGALQLTSIYALQDQAAIIFPEGFH